MQKDRKHGLAIAGLVCSVIGIAIFMFEIFVVGLTNSDKSTVSSTTTASEGTAEKNGKEESQDVAVDLASQMSITEYSMENSIGDTYYILVVKNNSNETVQLSVNAIAKDADGKTIGAASSSEDAVASGQEVCMLNYFDSVKDADTFEYTLTAKKDIYYKPVYSDLSVDESRTDTKVILTVTNTGDKAAMFVQAHAIFFKNGELIGYDYNYVTDDDSELKPGATLSKELECYSEYDDVKIYMSGRR